MILRFGDIPLTQNTNTNERCCGSTFEDAIDVVKNCSDSIWMYALGWALCLFGLLIFLIAGFNELFTQIDYGLWNVRFISYMDLTDYRKTSANLSRHFQIFDFLL